MVVYLPATEEWNYYLAVHVYAHTSVCIDLPSTHPLAPEISTIRYMYLTTVKSYAFGSYSSQLPNYMENKYSNLLHE